jgi:hypothetical protein
LALRQLSSAPEVWTGGRLAKAGIALAVVSAALSITMKQVHHYQLASEGREVADRFMETLKGGDVEGAFLLKLPTDFRERLKQMPAEELPGQLGEQYTGFRNELGSIGEAIARGEGSVQFEEVEGTYEERGMGLAAVVYKYHSEKEDTHVMVLAASNHSTAEHARTWYVREVKFGYTADSYSPQPAGGHGHAH